jgi:hypothetical protein
LLSVAIRNQRKDAVEFGFQGGFDVADLGECLTDGRIDREKRFDVAIGGNCFIDFGAFCVHDAGKGVFFMSDGSCDVKDNRARARGWAGIAGRVAKFSHNEKLLFCLL